MKLRFFICKRTHNSKMILKLVTCDLTHSKIRFTFPTRWYRHSRQCQRKFPTADNTASLQENKPKLTVGAALTRWFTTITN